MTTQGDEAKRAQGGLIELWFALIDIDQRWNIVDGTTQAVLRRTGRRPFIERNHALLRLLQDFGPGKADTEAGSSGLHARRRHMAGRTPARTRPRRTLLLGRIGGESTFWALGPLARRWIRRLGIAIRCHLPNVATPVTYVRPDRCHERPSFLLTGAGVMRLVGYVSPRPVLT